MILKKIICNICGKVFTPKNSRNIYCCKECGHLAKKLNARNKKIIKTCEICGKIFETGRKDKKVCSKECQKIKKQKYDKEYVKNNRIKINKRNRKYYKNNKEKCIQIRKKYESKNKKQILERRRFNKQKRRKENPEKYRQKDREYAKNKSAKIKEKERARKRERWHNDKEYKLKNIISHQIRDGLKENKTFKTFELLNYTSEDLIKHLESLFQDGMNWDNYGLNGWHIDHIKPIASFNLINEDGTQNLEEIKKCWSLDNLQPLWAKDNIIKSSWYTDENGVKKKY